MKLYLIRHASASDVAPSDAERALTKDGLAEARVVGNALKRLGVEPGHIVTSPLVRARQTAEIIATALSSPAPVEMLEELENGPSTSALVKALKPFAAEGELILVGHMPSLAEHLAEFIGVKNTAGFPFGKGTVACLEMEILRASAGQLRWLMRLKQLQVVAG